MVTSGAAPLIVSAFRPRRRSTSTVSGVSPNAERRTPNETRSKHATPDAPDCIDHPKRYTGHDQRTC
jgi:hypothetical protein